MTAESILKRRREEMVRRFLAGRGIRDERVLDAMRRVPRHRFVKKLLRDRAYEDRALPIGHDQTISQPWVVARMTEMLSAGPEDSVLEIGTGSGYQTAILARLAKWVYTLERVPELAKTAIERMRRLGFDNVKVMIFDGSMGWAEAAPYDRILVTAGAPAAPEPLIDQLGPGGRLLIPEGDRFSQRLVLYRRTPKGVVREPGEEVAFVPLLGRHGWDREGER